MNEKTLRLTKVLKDANFSVTKSRLAVFHYLLKNETVSVGSVTKALGQSVDRASVYRIITLFQDLGIVVRHNIGWKYTIELSDMFLEHHHHFTCTDCGKVVAMSEREMEKFVDKLAMQYDFVVTQHQIEIQGLCVNCK